MLDTTVIDDSGESWPLGAGRLREMVTSPEPDDAVMADAARKLGFVLVRERGQAVQAEMCPALVKPAALIGLYYSLLGLRPQRIVLSRFTAHGISHELFDDVSELAATIERGINDDRIRRYQPVYTSSPRPLKQLERSRYARFAPVVALWRSGRGRLPNNLVSLLNGHRLQGRAALLRNPSGTGRLVYEHVGSSYSFLGNACQPLLLIGQDIEMLPDRAYGGKAARSYYECLNDQEPRLETVNAVMRRADGQSVWSYYDRVLLPWRTAGGTRFVLGLSEVRRRMPTA
jgi:hypothetical protein